MPKTPQVRFNFKNLNVQRSTPLIGVVNVVARTTKGPFNDPSDLISGVPQFVAKFGSEIVPDGSVSNIQRALEMGAKVRITRVAGEGATYGWAKPLTVKAVTMANPSTAVPAGSSILEIQLTDPDSASAANTLKLQLGIRTREAGSPVIDNTGYNLNRKFYLKLNVRTEPSIQASIAQYAYNNESEKGDNRPIEDSFLAETMFYSATNQNFTQGVQKASINVDTFQNFVENAPNITFELYKAEGTGTMEDYADGILNMEDAIQALRQFNNWNTALLVGDTTSSTQVVEDGTASDNVYMQCTEGTAGKTPTDEEWKQAYYTSREYYESYLLILSHIHQHLPNDYMGVYKEVATDVNNMFEQVLAVEVPKYVGKTRVPATVEETLSKLKDMVQAIGPKKSVAYFGAGLKFYDNYGVMQKCDVLGTVAGLQTQVASNYGPWYSFSGMNRGVVADALGPVMENIGSPSKINTLQEFADWYMNVFVIKDTSTQGKRTMLWHGFTSNPVNDSEKFISVVMLGLYLKKNLRPILEGYIEEPNTFTTWKSIYYEAKAILDDLVSRNAIVSYEWLGDQFATNFDELQVNNEADVRQGKYHIILKYKEIVPLQDIEMDVVIDIAMNRTTGAISITSNI